MSNVVLSMFETLDIVNVRDKLPAVFERAIVDWAKFTVGMEKGLFTSEQADKTLTWFYQFPRLWEAYRGNFTDPSKLPSGMYATHGSGFVERVDRFVASLKASPFRTWVDLGIAPLIIGGVLVIGGIAAALWAVGYVKSQSNISAMIDGVVAGKVPPELLKKALEEQNKGGLLDDLGGVLKWGAIAIVGVMVLPKILDMIGSKKAHA